MKGNLIQLLNDDTVIIEKDSYICVDKLKGKNEIKHMVNVINKKGNTSLTRFKICKDKILDYSFSYSDNKFLWIEFVNE